MPEYVKLRVAIEDETGQTLAPPVEVTITDAPLNKALLEMAGELIAAALADRLL